MRRKIRPTSLAKQIPLIRPKDLGPNAHGGTLRDGRRKTARPFSPDAAMHIVLKSSLARGDRSLRHRSNRSKVDEFLFTQAERAGVRLYRHANAGNHLHLLVKSPSKSAFQRFLRAVSGLIARHVTGARKGRAVVSEAGFGTPARFWDRIPFSRILHWGREYAAVKSYLDKNALEASGFGDSRFVIDPCTGEPVLMFASSDGEGWVAEREMVADD